MKNKIIFVLIAILMALIALRLSGCATADLGESPWGGSNLERCQKICRDMGMPYCDLAQGRWCKCHR